VEGGESIADAGWIERKGAKLNETQRRKAEWKDGRIGLEEWKDGGSNFPLFFLPCGSASLRPWVKFFSSLQEFLNLLLKLSFLAAPKT
jgi:hypothetical protein